MKLTLRTLYAAAMVAISISATAQARYFGTARVSDDNGVAATTADTVRVERTPRSLEELNAYLDTVDMSSYDRLMSTRRLPRTVFLPAVFTGFEYPDTTSVFTPDFSGNPATEWIEEEMAM